MKTLIEPNTVGNATQLKELILAELNGIENKALLFRDFLNKLGGIGDVKVHEVKTRKTTATRRKVHRGGPAALHEALKSVNGEFNVDRAVGLSKEHKLDLDRVAVMNAIQSLIKKGKVNVVKAGLGRTQAIYELAKESSKSKKEAAAATS